MSSRRFEVVVRASAPVALALGPNIGGNSVRPIVVPDEELTGTSLVTHPLTRMPPFSPVELPAAMRAELPASHLRTGGNLLTGPAHHHNRDGILSVELMPTGERARKVVKRSNTRPTIKFASNKLNRMVQCDSAYEHAAAILLDVNAHVLRYAEQPAVILYRLNGEEHLHYPDFLVSTHTGSTFWEVKVRRNAAEPDVLARTEFLRRHLPEVGFGYQVVLGEHVLRKQRLANAKLLLRRGPYAMNLVEREQVRLLFQSVQSVNWAEVSAGKLPPLTVEKMARLVLEGELVADIDTPLDARTIVRRSATAILLARSA